MDSENDGEGGSQGRAASPRSMEAPADYAGDKFAEPLPPMGGLCDCSPAVPGFGAGREFFFFFLLYSVLVIF